MGGMSQAPKRLLAVPLLSIEEVLGLTVATARKRVAQLTDRERQIAVCITTGDPNREIATELGISVKTMAVHRGNILHTLSAHTSAQTANVVNLVRLAKVASETTANRS
jgi:FixJ family two-component response regulator